MLAELGTPFGTAFRWRPAANQPSSGSSSATTQLFSDSRRKRREPFLGQAIFSGAAAQRKGEKRVPLNN